MGALGPIANLIGFSTGGLGTGNTSSTPPLDNFFGLDGRFLKAPASSTAIFNNVLFGSSFQQVPIDFLANGFYTGVPPIFGGSGFTGMPARFDLFAGQAGLSGVDQILALENELKGGGAAGNSGASGSSGNALTGLLGLLLSRAAGGTSGTTARQSETGDQGNSSLASSVLKNMTLGDLLKSAILSRQ